MRSRKRMKIKITLTDDLYFFRMRLGMSYLPQLRLVAVLAGLARLAPAGGLFRTGGVCFGFILCHIQTLLVRLKLVSAILRILFTG